MVSLKKKKKAASRTEDPQLNKTSNKQIRISVYKTKITQNSGIIQVNT